MYIQMSEEFPGDLLLFSVDFYSMVYILCGLNIGCFNTVVKLYFLFCVKLMPTDSALFCLCKGRYAL